MAGTWLKVLQKGMGPGARSSHAIAVVGRRAYAFGGEFTPRVPVDNDLHVLDLKDGAWSVAKAVGDVPPPRVGVTMAALGGTIYVFGGRDADHKELNELYSFDTSASEWTLLSSGEVGPPHRSYHSMAADRGRVYVFGGCGNAGRLKDLWAFDVEGRQWVELPAPGESFRPRGGPGLAVCGGKVWVVYGFSGDELDDVHCFDPVDGSWTLVETTGDKPSPRSVFSIAAIGKHLVVYGGEVDPSDQGHLGAGKFSPDAYALDTETGAWRKLKDVSGEHPGPAGGARSRRRRRRRRRGRKDCWFTEATRRRTTGWATSSSSLPSSETQHKKTDRRSCTVFVVAVDHERVVLTVCRL